MDPLSSIPSVIYPLNFFFFCKGQLVTMVRARLSSYDLHRFTATFSGIGVYLACLGHVRPPRDVKHSYFHER